jgi:hypothetical protein
MAGAENIYRADGPTPSRSVPCGAVEIRSRDRATPFVTADGSTIRSLLDLGTAPVQRQSLAEATIAAGEATQRHHHRVAEELYYLLEGGGSRGPHRRSGHRARIGARPDRGHRE